MKKCPFCAKENYKEKYFCESCGSYLGSDYPGGLPPSPSNKAKALIEKQTNTTPAKHRSQKPRKEVEYVRLSHGRVMKKSTYDWLQKKDASANALIWVFIGISIFLALVKGCN